MQSKEDYSKRMLYLRESIGKINFGELEITPEDLKDPYCDPESPIKIDFEHVSAAAYRLKGGIENTPCTVIFLNYFYYFKKYFHNDIHSVHICLMFQKWKFISRKIFYNTLVVSKREVLDLH